MEIVEIQEKMYHFVSSYLDTPQLLESFNELARNTFDFELSHWDDSSYIPYSLLDGEKIVANVSVQKFTFEFEGNIYHTANILTVMTDENYRKQGLSAFLMKRVIAEWENNCDFLYLFANDEVLEFYPRFGFKKVQEFFHYTEKLPEPVTRTVKKLDGESEAIQFMKEMIRKGMVGTAFSCNDGFGLIEWLCGEIYGDQLFYIEDLHVLAVVEYDNQTVRLQALFGNRDADLLDIIASLIREDTTRVELGFTPKDSDQFGVEALVIDNSTLFLLHDAKDVFTRGNIRFPLITRT